MTFFRERPLIPGSLPPIDSDPYKRELDLAFSNLKAGLNETYDTSWKDQPLTGSELERYNELAVQIETFEHVTPIGKARRMMPELVLSTEQRITNRMARNVYWKYIISTLNGGPGLDGSLMISAGQLMQLANQHPALGYYPDTYGVGETANSRLTSAFDTPMSTDAEARAAHVEFCETAFRKLKKTDNISPKNPFRVFIVGDGSGNLLREILNSGMPRAMSEVVLLDASASMLEKQKAKLSRLHQERTRFIQGDAVDFAEVIKAHGLTGSKGVIILEELFDALPHPFITKLAGSQEPHEMYVGFDFFGLEGNIVGGARKPNYATQHILDAWFRAFPQYQEYFDQLQNVGGDYFGVNIASLRLMKGIADAQFKGYVVGHDYSESYLYPSLMLGRPATQPGLLRAYGMNYNGTQRGQQQAIDAFEYPADVTADFDPSLWNYARAFGMDIEFMGRMGHYMQIARGRNLLSREEVYDRVMKLDGKYKGPDLLEQMQIYDARYSGGRQNWIVRAGGAPQYSAKQYQVW